MQREFRLKDEDLLDLTHFPIQAVFNMVDDERFLKVINSVCEGVGFGEEYGACTFQEIWMSMILPMEIHLKG